MAIETKEQQSLRRIATALEKLTDVCEESKSKMWAKMSEHLVDGINDALVDTKKQDGPDRIKIYAQEVKAYCKNTNCDFCTLCDDGLCLLGHSVPENWEV